MCRVGRYHFARVRARDVDVSSRNVFFRPFLHFSQSMLTSALLYIRKMPNDKREQVNTPVTLDQCTTNVNR